MQEPIAAQPTTTAPRQELRPSAPVEPLTLDVERFIQTVGDLKASGMEVEPVRGVILQSRSFPGNFSESLWRTGIRLSVAQDPTDYLTSRHAVDREVPVELRENKVASITPFALRYDRNGDRHEIVLSNYADPDRPIVFRQAVSLNPNGSIDDGSLQPLIAAIQAEVQTDKVAEQLQRIAATADLPLVVSRSPRMVEPEERQLLADLHRDGFEITALYYPYGANYDRVIAELFRSDPKLPLGLNTVDALNGDRLLVNGNVPRITLTHEVTRSSLETVLNADPAMAKALEANDRSIFFAYTDRFGNTIHRQLTRDFPDGLPDSLVEEKIYISPPDPFGRGPYSEPPQVIQADLEGFGLGTVNFGIERKLLPVLRQVNGALVYADIPPKTFYSEFSSAPKLVADGVREAEAFMGLAEKPVVQKIYFRTESKSNAYFYPQASDTIVIADKTVTDNMDLTLIGFHESAHALYHTLNLPSAEGPLEKEYLKLSASNPKLLKIANESNYYSRATDVGHGEENPAELAASLTSSIRTDENDWRMRLSRFTDEERTVYRDLLVALQKELALASTNGSRSEAGPIDSVLSRRLELLGHPVATKEY